MPAQEQDRNDGKQWSEADIEDLALALKDGGTVEGAAYFLCRGDTIEEVRHKAKELGLIVNYPNRNSRRGCAMRGC